MDERVKFIARFLEGEKVSRLALEFGISRKTAYKIIERYQDTGLEGLTDGSRRPYHHANQLPFQIETASVRLKREKPAWGRRRSWSFWPGATRTSTGLRSRRSMRCSTVMGW